LAYIVWKRIKTGYYAYLQECYYSREQKGPVTKGTYLGGKPRKAEIKLRKLIQDPKQLVKLIDDLYRKQPVEEPGYNEITEVIRVLKKLAAKAKDRQIQEVLLEALKKLENEKAIKESAEENIKQEE